MPAKIIEYIQHPKEFPRRDQTDQSLDLLEEIPTRISPILRMFRNEYKIDFSYYKETTIHRRLERRIKLSRSDTIEAYIDRLQSDRNELDLLYRDLLVEVTQFFRDPEAWTFLRKEVIPKIICNAEEEIRVWVAACATGEEAYSMAMLFHDVALEMDCEIPIKVFATDVHQKSLEIASTGVYSVASIGKVLPELQERYFVRAGELIHVSKELRKMVIFAPHDLTRDPPFTKIDLVSCRNVLIYLESPVQQKILSLFHFGLNVSGVLFLGPSETIGDLAPEFDTIDQHWKFFTKIRNLRLSASGNVPMATPLASVIRSPHSALVNPPGVGDRNWTVPDVYDDLLQKYVPPSLLVDDKYDLAHSFGDARSFLQQPEGRPTMDVIKMLTGELRMAVSAALHRATQKKTSVVFRGVKSGREDEIVNVVVEPLTKANRRLFLICLEAIKRPELIEDSVSSETFDSIEQSTQQINNLERELAYTRESLQATVEELETSNEELQSTNEELVASNEELQSTNEELHSVNEELYTVNSEHQRKITELTALTNDMNNLLHSTEIGTIFLDSELKIRKFTPTIADAFKVIDQDIGRPIDHIAYNFDHPEFLSDVRDVLQNGKPVERDITSLDGESFLNRMRAYRTEDGRVEGVVISFISLANLKQAEAELIQRAEELSIKNKELERFNRLTAGREVRMVELKREVNSLCRELNAPVRYDTNSIDVAMTQARELTPRNGDTANE